LLLITLSVQFSINNFKINADLTGLVEQTGQWRTNLDQVNAAFPDQSNLLVVITSPNMNQTQLAVEKLQSTFSTASLFTDVFATSSLPFIKQQMLGFMTKAEFNHFEQQFQRYIPDIIASQNQLPQYLASLAANLKQASSEEEQLLLVAPLKQLIETGEVNWPALLQPDDQSPSVQVISLMAKPQLDTKEPNKLIMETVQALITEANLPTSVKVRLTGQTALDYDEIVDANDSVGIAGAVSLFSLMIILTIGIKSARIIMASYISVMIGLIFTIALGLAIVGSFNTISIVFLVIFIGLGVDFAIHLSLHIYEQRVKGYDNQQSLIKSLQHSITPLGLCAISSAIGFMSFYPTAYKGLGELGVISAVGMFVGLVVTFVVIPLFFQFFGYPSIKKHDLKPNNISNKLANVLAKNAIKTVLFCVFLGITSSFIASQFRFDFSTLVLKNKASESVQTLEYLQQQKLGSSYQLLAVADSQQQALNWQQSLSQLPEVATSLSANDLIAKSLKIRQQQLQQLIMTKTQTSLPPLSIEDLLTWGVQVKLAPRVIAVLTALENIPTLLIEDGLFAPVQQQLAVFEEAGSTTFSLASMPNELRKRFITENNEWLVSITPAGDMRNVTELDNFIQAVQNIAPLATGRAVAEQEVGKTIIRAFYQAIITAIIGIIIVLFFAIKRKLDIILIFVPLLLTATVTIAIAHSFGQSLNMANIIVIPLIFGLGVDNGIHIVQRFRKEKSIKRFFASSTPKATLFSCLTTIATFAALMLADHQGMYSIGFLLTIALTLILLFSLLVLPALLHLFSGNTKAHTTEDSSD
ncbi:MAG: MMPL family transporter, partial [Psychromonas sp.]